MKLTEVINAALACGLSLSDFEKLEIGMIVDVIIARYKQNSTETDEPSRRIATQSDWDRFSSS